MKHVFPFCSLNLFEAKERRKNLSDDNSSNTKDGSWYVTLLPLLFQHQRKHRGWIKILPLHASAKWDIFAQSNLVFFKFEGAGSTHIHDNLSRHSSFLQAPLLVQKSPHQVQHQDGRPFGHGLEDREERRHGHANLEPRRTSNQSS